LYAEVAWKIALASLEYLAAGFLLLAGLFFFVGRDAARVQVLLRLWVPAVKPQLQKTLKGASFLLRINLIFNVGGGTNGYT
jgi:hypothetical protein